MTASRQARRRSFAATPPVPPERVGINAIASVKVTILPQSKGTVLNIIERRPLYWPASALQSSSLQHADGRRS